MNKIKVIISLVGLLITLPTLSSQDPVETVKVFKNIKVINVENGAIAHNQFIVLAGDSIRFVGAALPSKYTQYNQLDFNGQYALPGFIDTHAHISLGEVSFRKKRGKLGISAHSSDDISKWNARELLNWGVTYIRNPGGSSKYNLKYKTQVASGEISGPEAIIAGEIINRGAFHGLAVDINSHLTLETAISKQKQAGIDIIKLYAGLTDEDVKQAIALGHQQGLKVIAHLEQVSWTDAANWKIDGLVHAMPISPSLLTDTTRAQYLKESRPGTFAHFQWFEHVDLDSAPMLALYEALKTNQTHIDPTLIVFKNSFYGNTKNVKENDGLKYVHPELLNNWQSFFTFNVGWTKSDFDRAQKVWPKVLAFIKRLHQESVPLTIGTDLGNPWVIPGYSLHQEMQLFADAGIPNKDILKMATLTAAKQLGIDNQHGSIEAGKKANIVFLTANPLDDITNTQKISSVYVAGAEFTDKNKI